jgi:hypothetical protein
MEKMLVAGYWFLKVITCGVGVFFSRQDDRPGAFN